VSLAHTSTCIEGIVTYKAKIINRDVNGPAVTASLFDKSQPTDPWNFYGNEAWGVASGPSATKRDYLQRGWNTLTGWKAFRAANGYLPTNAMTESYHRHNQGDFIGCVFVRYTMPGVKLEVPRFNMQIQDMSTFSGFLASSPDFDGIVDPAKSKCLSKARDMKVNAAVSLGEGRQTVRMIRDIAQKLGNAYSAFRKGNFKRAAKVLNIKKPVGEAANHWLAYNYGWSPLLSDVKGLAELAAQHLALGGRGPRLKVTSRNRVSNAVSAYGALGQGSYFLNVDYHLDGDWTYEGHAGLLLQLVSTEAALAAQLGFGATDPALLAWELTPFSFVFDWFIDVGQWLESASSLQGWTVLSGYASLKQTFIGSQRFENPRAWTLPYEEWNIPSSCPVMQTFYTRALWSGQVPFIRSPLWDGLNARRLTTTAALWKQLTQGDRAKGAYRP
jgi:hypothetical protein